MYSFTILKLVNILSLSYIQPSIVNTLTYTQPEYKTHKLGNELYNIHKCIFLPVVLFMVLNFTGLLHHIGNLFRRN